ncbi:replication protein [Genomoviridae sp.]|nr:replication protein [Genomoviridae sp.]
MDEYSEDAEYAVFDDIQGGFEYFHSYKGWLGAQKQFVITDKYRKKRTIYWGKPSIMCMNEDPHFAKGVDYDWLINNCYIINVVDPICIVSSQPHANNLSAPAYTYQPDRLIHQCTGP